MKRRFYGVGGVVVLGAALLLSGCGAREAAMRAVEATATAAAQARNQQPPPPQPYVAPPVATPVLPPSPTGGALATWPATKAEAAALFPGTKPEHWQEVPERGTPWVFNQGCVHRDAPDFSGIPVPAGMIIDDPQAHGKRPGTPIKGCVFTIRRLAFESR